MRSYQIIGAGVSGLCLAYFLSARGNKVTVFDSRNPNDFSGPSYLKRQVIRSLYLDQPLLGSRMSSALTVWRKIFEGLRANYFIPKGAISVSREPGDWTDRLMKTLYENHIDFRYLKPEQLRNLCPGINLNEAKFALLAEIGGELLGRKLMFDLISYLEEKGVKIRRGVKIKKLKKDGNIVAQNGESFGSDWTIVTGGQKTLMPDVFADMHEYCAYVAQIYSEQTHHSILWKFAPNWIDLGGSQNLWGLPRYNSRGEICLGAGCLTHRVDQQVNMNIEETFKAIYRPIILDFDSYQFRLNNPILYSGFENGCFEMRRDGQNVALVGDCGHGFKFAAENAEFTCEALETENFVLANRKIQGHRSGAYLS